MTEEIKYETIDTSGRKGDSFVIGVLKSNQKLSEDMEIFSFARNIRILFSAFS
jgi:hypothetical protein